jgi:hypothetical protein
VASIAPGTVPDRAKPTAGSDKESVRVIKVTYSVGPAVEGTRLTSALQIRTTNPGCINHNYLKCHL